MRASVGDIAALVAGEVIGDPERLITGISSLQEAKEGDITFLANPRYAPFLLETRASAVLLGAAQPQIRERSGAPTQIVVANADFAFARVVNAYGPRSEPPPAGIHPTAVIGERVRLGKELRIGPYVVIGDGAEIGDGTTIHAQVYIGAETVLGADCVLYPQVVIRERVRLGARVILHPGAVIGADGFGYASVQGVHHKIPQVGTVEIADDVEIGAATTIDRARFGCTRIGKGTKIDNLVQIAHNVEIGAGCLVVAQVGIAGSTRIGNYVVLAGQVGIAGHVVIGDQAVVTAKSGVSKDVPPRTVVRGAPAQENKAAQILEVAMRRLPGTQQQVKELLARVAELERRLGELGGSR
jgi:UDP-3-O-[3-hydroxymyristoyl] glucosamine N-acyltransferase